VGAAILLQVADSILTEKHMEILRRQERMIETGKKIVSLMSEADKSKPYKMPASVENMTLQIFHDMNTIAQLAGGDLLNSTT
jgi:hypothetical protein